MIAGRLAQLSDQAREIAATAAVIGRAFDLDVLVRLVGDEEVVVRALDELWRKRIVREQGPNAYDFTHDKLRDVAYGETSAPQRRRLHRRVAEALVAAAREGPRPRQRPDRRALRERRPARSRRSPTTRARRSSPRASTPTTRPWPSSAAGLSLLRELPASARRDGWELELQLLLAPSYRVTLGWAAPELGERARPRPRPLRARGHGRPARAGPLRHAVALHRRGPAREVRGDHGRDGARLPRDAGLRAATFGVRHAGGRPRSRWATSRRPATTSTTSSAKPTRPAPAPAGIAGPELRGDRPGLAVARALVPRPSGHGLRARVPRAAPGRASSGSRSARRSPRPTWPCSSSSAPIPPPSARQAEEALELSPRSSRRPTTAPGPPSSSPTRRRSAARTRPRSTRLRSAIDSFKETGARLRLPYYLALLADAHLRAGEAAAGLDVVEEGLSRGRETNERWWDAELHRLRAELLLAGGAAAAEAEAALKRALEIARAQQAKSLELRAARALRSSVGGHRAGRARPGTCSRPSILRSRKASRPPTSRGARALLARLG